MGETFNIAKYEDMVQAKADILEVKGNSIPVYTTKNLFNKKTVTLGYYVNMSTGELKAASTYSASDWIPIEAGVTYIDNISSHYAFYTSEKTYISGDSTYTKVAPANAAYIRISVQIFNLDIAQLEVGTTNTSYVPYLQFHSSDILFEAPSVTVKTSGGDYTSVQDAIDNINGTENCHAKIYIYPGTYNEEIIGKNFVDIIGVDRDTCILTATGDPLNPLIHDTIKSTYTMDIKNLTILGTNGSKYCVHMDAYGAYTARFINCVFIKEIERSAFGIGLHASQNLELINCVITGADLAVYCHNWDNQASSCSLTIHNCKLTGNTRSGLYLDSLGSHMTDLVILTNNEIVGIESSMTISRNTDFSEDEDNFQIIASGNQIDTVKRINGALTSFSQPVVSETVFTDVQGE